jgi:hypothetical protein
LQSWVWLQPMPSLKHFQVAVCSPDAEQTVSSNNDSINLLAKFIPERLIIKLSSEKVMLIIQNLKT